MARREEGIEEASPKFLVRQLGGGEGQLSDGSDRERAVVVGDSREVLPVVDRDPEGAPPVVAGPFGEPGEPGVFALREHEELGVEREVEAPS